MKMLSFGEILFDVFPSSRRIGGAPLNVAAHFAKLLGESTIVSAVGNDELGAEAIKEVAALGLDTSHIKVSKYDTGRADITMQGKNADYTFNEPAAWDDITLDRPLEKNYDIIYFGTLVQRNRTSRETLAKILSSTNAKHVFYDVNIRKHFYTDEIILSSLERATILKVNDEELPLIAKIADAETDNERNTAAKLIKDFNLEMVILTKGKEGTAIFTRDGQNSLRPGDVPVIDTVGAGDSLSAGLLATYLKSGDIIKALRVGSALADYVVSHRGAIPSYDEAFTAFLEKEGMLHK